MKTALIIAIAVVYALVYGALLLWVVLIEVRRRRHAWGMVPCPSCGPVHLAECTREHVAVRAPIRSGWGR